MSARKSAVTGCTTDVVIVVKLINMMFDGNTSGNIQSVVFVFASS